MGINNIFFRLLFQLLNLPDERERRNPEMDGKKHKQQSDRVRKRDRKRNNNPIELEREIEKGTTLR